MHKIQLKILGISQGNVASSYTLILEEVRGERKLPIVIGVLEAQAIAIEIEKMKPLRPMTHDLFKLLTDNFGLMLKEVIIYKLHEGVFHANLVVSDGKIIKEIDSRTSDAIALSLRYNCPIYTTEEIMDKAGISISPFKFRELEEDEREGDVPEKDSSEVEVEDKDFSKLSLSKLKKLLKDALSVEDYKRAAKLRDAIKKREEEDYDIDF